MLRTIERFCELVELVAGILLGAVMMLIVASTAGRYLFAWTIPDSFDMSRLLIGACIMWGLASIGYRGGHIAVDLVYEMAGGRMRRLIDLFAWAVLLGFTVMLTWMLWYRVTGAYTSNESTFDLRLPVWPLIALIWVGCAVSVITVGLSILRAPRENDDPDFGGSGQ
ncbi:TRAP transporter small permease [Mesorhizobium sp. CAU 1741]|uniref:TRAP transporter small permease n=1 Tax=Mesorhizobium sp. CAU 1741 TaxID=3140366 RepID=UPI00325A8319